MNRTYRFRAARGDGTLLRGVIDAVSGAQAVALLLERGLHPLEVAASDPAELRHRAASRAELAIVFRSLAALIAVGVPLARALAGSQRLAGPALRHCLAAAGAGLRDGRTLAQALDGPGGTVPRIVLGMLRAGEQGGRLAITLEQIATQLELELELAGRLRHALAYPLVLVAAGLASVLVIGTVVIPKFAVLLSEAGQDLPALTRWLLLGSGLIARYWPPLLLAALAAALAFPLWSRQPSARRRLHRFLMRVPIIRSIRHELATTRVTRSLGGALEAGMPLLPALDTAMEAAGDLEIMARLALARERVARGEPLTAALASEAALAPAALQLVEVGESSGQLGNMMKRAGDLSARESERVLVTLLDVLEPALVVTIGGFVALVAAGLLQAVYSLRPAGT